MNKNFKIIPVVACAVAIITVSVISGIIVRKSLLRREVAITPAKDVNIEQDSENEKQEDLNIFTAYKDVLSKNNMCKYYVFDFDNDNILELILEKWIEEDCKYNLEVYTFTWKKGAELLGTIESDDDMNCQLCKIKSQNGLALYYLSENGWNSKTLDYNYIQKVVLYTKEKNELNSSVLFEKHYDSWCLEIEQDFLKYNYEKLKTNEEDNYIALLKDAYDLPSTCLDGSVNSDFFCSNLEYSKDDGTITDNDIFNLGRCSKNTKSFINNFFGVYHCECVVNINGSGKVNVNDLVRRIIGEGAHDETYRYYFDDVEEINCDNTTDPLKRFANNATDFGWSSVYRVYSEKNIKWIVENIFNVQYSVDSFDVNDSEFKGYLKDGKYYVQKNYIENEYGNCYMDSFVENEDGTYAVCCRDFNSDETSYMVVALKVIDGQRRWTIVELEK